MSESKWFCPYDKYWFRPLVSQMLHQGYGSYLCLVGGKDMKHVLFMWLGAKHDVVWEM